MTKNVIVTCPPMLGQFDKFVDLAAEKGLTLHRAKTTQILSEEELCELLPKFDGWVIGDDPATRRVFEAGKAGRLKAAVKWGIGVDNVDFAACEDLEIPVINTPAMFGAEVADVATAYVIGLARGLFVIDRGVRVGSWPKPAGISLAGKRVGVVGFGDIGRQTATRLQALGLKVCVYDPGVDGDCGLPDIERSAWPDKLGKHDFLVFTCALTKSSFHMLNAETLCACKKGVRVVNVARGPLIDEDALITSLDSGHVESAALDVFEVEPLPEKSPLRKFDKCIFGAHNGSNTVDAVIRASHEAISRLHEFLVVGVD
jgi:phosphoglycerate dehydrogenase-like enzyme